MNKKVLLMVDDETIEIKNALIGARMEDGEDTLFSVYAGQMDIGEIGLAMLHSLRAVLKISVDELGLSMELAEDFVSFTLEEAVRLENLRKDDVTRHRDVEAFVKKYMGNQY